MPGQRSGPGSASRAAHEAVAAASHASLGHVCPVCSGSGVADEPAVLAAAYRLRGGEPRRARRRRPSEERRRELANKLTSHGMPTEVAATIFRVSPKAVV